MKHTCLRRRFLEFGTLRSRLSREGIPLGLDTLKGQSRQLLFADGSAVILSAVSPGVCSEAGDCYPRSMDCLGIRDCSAVSLSRHQRHATLRYIYPLCRLSLHVLPAQGDSARNASSLACAASLRRDRSQARTSVPSSFLFDCDIPGLPPKRTAF